MNDIVINPEIIFIVISCVGTIILIIIVFYLIKKRGICENGTSQKFSKNKDKIG